MASGRLIRMLRRILALALAAALLAGCTPLGNQEARSPADQVLANALSQRTSGVQVSGSGTVSRILADDVNGDRHQRFTLTLSSGQTLLVAHNIDIAPRIDSLRQGDSVEFSGVYEYNDEGGVIHWTHHDPDGSHVSGWLKHGGRLYQ
jgi:hypothetical protein